MAEIRERCLLTFRSVHQRLTAQQILSNYRISVELVPVPPGVRTNCDKALEMDCRHQPKVVEILKERDVGIEKILRIMNEEKRLLERLRGKGGGY